MNATTPLWTLMAALALACAPASASDDGPQQDCPPVTWEGNTPGINPECFPADPSESGLQATLTPVVTADLVALTGA